jgi:hypothetical protein
MILTNARVLTFDAANHVLASGSVDILPNGSIGRVAEGWHASPEAIDAGGKLLMRAHQLPHPPVQHARPRHPAPRPGP